MDKVDFSSFPGAFDVKAFNEELMKRECFACGMSGHYKNECPLWTQLGNAAKHNEQAYIAWKEVNKRFKVQEESLETVVAMD